MLHRQQRPSLLLRRQPFAGDQLDHAVDPSGGVGGVAGAVGEEGVAAERDQGLFDVE